MNYTVEGTDLVLTPETVLGYYLLAHAAQEEREKNCKHLDITELDVTNFFDPKRVFLASCRECGFSKEVVYEY
jgi:hypothetical protein